MHIYFYFCGVVADVASLSRNHNYEYAHEFINESRRYARELSNGMEWKSKRARKFNALNCFVAPLQNWLKAKKIFFAALYTFVCILLIVCYFVALWHTHTPRHRLAYMLFCTDASHSFFLMSNVCTLCMAHCVYVHRCVCVLCTQFYLATSTVVLFFFTHDFFRFFDDIFAQRFQV